jgi:endonuclease/exonuclease/phosphatase (EEP) superfamily protein YafD
MSPYKYGSGWMPSHIGSINVFSKLPLTMERQDWTTGKPLHTVEMQLGDETLRLVGLHAPRPMPLPKYDYYGFWRQATPKLLTERGPLVVVGDFNATEHSRAYQELTSAGLRSAHEDRGRGWATTWPNGEAWAPPIRIDQAFLSPDVECVRIAEGRGKGSDHKPLILDVRVRRPAVSGQNSILNQR